MTRALKFTALAASALMAAIAGAARAADHPAVARDMAGVWLPDSHASGRLPKDLPFTADARKAADDYQRRYGPIDATVDDANASCIPEAFPYGMRLIAQYPFELLFTPDRLTMFFEVFGGVRRVYLDARAAPLDALPTAMGRSVGHWEGDTLVVETTRVRKVGAGLMSGDPPVGLGRRFVERLSLGVDAEGRKQLRNDITIHDTAVFTQPVKLQMFYKWSPDIEVGEYLCQQDIWDQNVQGSPSSVPWRQ